MPWPTLTWPVKTAVPAAWSRSSRSEVISTGSEASCSSPPNGTSACASASPGSITAKIARSPRILILIRGPADRIPGRTPSEKENRRASPVSAAGATCRLPEVISPSGPVLTTSSPATKAPARRSIVALSVTMR